MCTITLAWQAFPDSPVVVGANRDEFLDRPSEPPARRDWETPVIAPKDSEADGTWIGYNEAGVLVAITNRWMGRDIDSDRSRGLLVRDALQYESAEDAIRYVERETDQRSYDGFNLLAADANSAVLVEWDGHISVQNLEPGVHVIVNVGANGEYDIPAERQSDGETQAANATQLRDAIVPEPGEDGASWLKRSGDIIADHEYGVCIHGEAFGTRSSSLIRLGEDEALYQYADGPPCRTEYTQVADILPVQF